MMIEDRTGIDNLVDEELLRLSKVVNHSFEELHAEFEEAYLGWYMRERHQRENHDYLCMKALSSVMGVYDEKEMV